MFPQSRACEARVQSVIKIHKRNENFKNGRFMLFWQQHAVQKPFFALYGNFVMFSISKSTESVRDLD